MFLFGLFVIINILDFIVLLGYNAISLIEDEVFDKIFAEPPSAVELTLRKKYKGQYKTCHQTDLDVKREIVLNKELITWPPKDMIRAVMP